MTFFHASFSRYCLFFGCICGVFFMRVSAQERHTVSGYLTALSSGEALSNAKIYVPSVNKGALANSYGFYSLTLPAGIYEVEYRFTGYPTVRKTLDLSTKDVSMNVELGFKDGERSFEEVVVNGKKGENVNSTKL
ncbi:MAG: carboxypeptidase-like regulatory domain-containing protein, partial [Flavobacteriia bacterium]|nr:carboxypeptidase-like regulatory domain-containing protein [Flavobacteriia bacterium]